MSSETFKDPAGKRFLFIAVGVFLLWACMPFVLRLTQILSS